MKTNGKIDFFVELVAKKIREQYEYDMGHNVQNKIMTLAEAQTGENAIKTGLASAVNTLNEWGCEEAIKFAFEILEDANCHSEAGALIEAAKKNGLNV
jgi:hypothetical protein